MVVALLFDKPRMALLVIEPVKISILNSAINGFTNLFSSCGIRIFLHLIKIFIDWLIKCVHRREHICVQKYRDVLLLR